MQTYISLSDERLLPAVLFCVCLLALVLMLTVRITKSQAPHTGEYYSKDFDRGSFRDWGTIGLILLPFVIIYALRNWV